MNKNYFMLQKITVTILTAFTIIIVSQRWNNVFAQTKELNEYIQITDENCFYKFNFESYDTLHAKVIINLPQGTFRYECKMEKNQYCQSGMNDLNRVKYDCKQDGQAINIILGYEIEPINSTDEMKLIEIVIMVEEDGEKYLYRFNDSNGLPMSFKIE